MKYLLVIVLSIVLSLFLMGQGSPPKSPLVETYIKFLADQTLDSTLQSKVASISLADLKRAARLCYEATEDDPTALRQQIQKKHHSWDSVYAKQKSAIGLGWKTGAVEIMYLHQIDTILSHRIYALVRAPNCLRLVISSMKAIRVPIGGINRTYQRTVIDATVLEVFKGSKRFSPGGPVEFYFNKGWIHNPNYFHLGDTCLVLLDPRTSQDGKIWLAVFASLDDANGYYEIKGNVLYDKFNTFGYGNEIPWDVFKGKLLTEINTIKSW